MPDRPEIVCLCGSLRFARELRAVARDLSLAGIIVLAPAELGEPAGGTGGDGDAPPPTAEQKARLDALHRHKIDLADRVLVVDPDGHVGASTRAEIAHAETTGTPVDYTHPPDLEGRRNGA
ncbi:hypothetical protein DFJ68_1216 [Terracoccus luteus]|uniref:Uncharacterized protein n=1 Tax=Terracoccus luteus TaxID=53356 RepID=A0A495Y1G2_9MICO|nr:hypothetical protein [Terracoccus luteus]RKT77788.1 hypothetical protein DFJ68_1216 [Terracoccus luteus]